MPTSWRSETTACWRSASTWRLADSVMRAASAWAWPRISATIEAPCSRAASRISLASVRAPASWALYFSRAAWASAWASSACCMPPSMAAARSSYIASIFGTTLVA